MQPDPPGDLCMLPPSCCPYESIVVETLWAPDALLTHAGCICHHSFPPGNQAHLHAPLINNLHYSIYYWSYYYYSSAIDISDGQLVTIRLQLMDTGGWQQLPPWLRTPPWHGPVYTFGGCQRHGIIPIVRTTECDQTMFSSWGVENGEDVASEDAGSGEWEARGTWTGMSLSLWTFCSAPLPLCRWFLRT